MLLNRAERVWHEEVIKSKWARFLKGECGLWDGGAVALVLGKGGDIVADVPDELEIERLRNLVIGFGWKIVKTETLTDRIILTVELERKASGADASPGPT